MIVIDLGSKTNVVRSRSGEDECDHSEHDREDHEANAGNHHDLRQIEDAAEHDHGSCYDSRASADRKRAHWRRGRQRKPRFLRSWAA